MEKISRRNFTKSFLWFGAFCVVSPSFRINGRNENESPYESLKRLLVPGNFDVIYQNLDTKRTIRANGRDGSLDLVDDLPLDVVRGARDTFALYSEPGGVVYTVK